MIVLITGATAGFGKATAQLFASKGFDLIITGRRTQRLNDLKKEIESMHKVNVIALDFDIRNFSQVERAINELPDSFKKIELLVNNAGLAVGMSSIHDGLIDDWERMVDTNVKGLLYMTRIVSPLMIQQKRGHIINVGSIAEIGRAHV